MRQANVADAERIEAHQPGGHGVDRHLVAAREYDVFDLGMHRARSGPVARRCAVHHREDAAVDLLLNCQEVDQRLVDPTMRVMPTCVQQTTEGIFHSTRCGSVDVALYRRQVDDVLSLEVVGNPDPFGKDLVQNQHFRPGLESDPGHVVVLEVVEHRDAVALEDRQIAVQVFAFEGVGDDRLVLNTHQLGEAVGAQSTDGALELPRRRVRGWEREVPADVVLENGGCARGLVLLALVRRQVVEWQTLTGAGLFAVALVGAALWVRWRLPLADLSVLAIAATLAAVGQIMTSRLEASLGPRQGTWVLIGLGAMTLVGWLPSIEWLRC